MKTQDRKPRRLRRSAASSVALILAATAVSGLVSTVAANAAAWSRTSAHPHWHLMTAYHPRPSDYDTPASRLSLDTFSLMRPSAGLTPGAAPFYSPTAWSAVGPASIYLGQPGYNYAGRITGIATHPTDPTRSTSLRRAAASGRPRTAARPGIR